MRLGSASPKPSLDLKGELVPGAQQILLSEEERRSGSPHPKGTWLAHCKRIPY
jgi:hypothetical protein